MTSVGLLSAWLRAYAVGGERYERFTEAAQNPGYLLGEALDASGFFALPIEAAATTDTMTGFNPLKDPLMAAFPDAPQGGQGVRRIGVDPVGKLLGPSAGLIADASKAAGAPIGAAMSRVEAKCARAPAERIRAVRAAPTAPREALPAPSHATATNVDPDEADATRRASWRRSLVSA